MTSAWRVGKHRYQVLEGEGFGKMNIDFHNPEGSG